MYWKYNAKYIYISIENNYNIKKDNKFHIKLKCTYYIMLFYGKHGGLNNLVSLVWSYLVLKILCIVTFIYKWSDDIIYMKFESHPISFGHESWVSQLFFISSPNTTFFVIYKLKTKMTHTHTHTHTHTVCVRQDMTCNHSHTTWLHYRPIRSPTDRLQIKSFSSCRYEAVSIHFSTCNHSHTTWLHYRPIRSPTDRLQIKSLQN